MAEGHWMAIGWPLEGHWRAIGGPLEDHWRAIAPIRPVVPLEGQWRAIAPHGVDHTSYISFALLPRVRTFHTFHALPLRTLFVGRIEQWLLARYHSATEKSFYHDLTASQMWLPRRPFGVKVDIIAAAPAAPAAPTRTLRS